MSHVPTRAALLDKFNIINIVLHAVDKVVNLLWSENAKYCILGDNCIVFENFMTSIGDMMVTN